MAGSVSKSAGVPTAMLDGVTVAADWVAVWPVVLPMVGAALLLMLRRKTEWQAAFAFAIIAATLASNLYLVGRVYDAGVLTMAMGNWLPPFGISFTVDMLGALFSLIASVVSLIVVVYAQGEIEPRANSYGYHPLLLMLLAGVSGAFLTGDLFNLYVWFEVMLIASFGLMVIGGRKIQLDAALKYGFLNFLATTFFLIGIALLYGLVGTLSMADIMDRVLLVENESITAIAAIFFLAFAIKGAAFPVNSWLPASYHTLDPAVSALFAGVLTKVGIYALARVHFMLIPQSFHYLQAVMLIVACATLVVSPLCALAQTNIRRALGFFLMGGIGSMIAGLAFGPYPGGVALSLYAIHSMLVMTAFYLVAGLVERMGGTSDIRHLGGLYRASPVLSMLFLILVFATAGLPPFLGFWPKLALVNAGIVLADSGADAMGKYHWWLVAALLVNSILTSVAGTRIWAHVFWRNGREGKQSEIPNERIVPLSSRGIVAGMGPTVALVAVIVVAGLFPDAYFEAGTRSGLALADATGYRTAVFGGEGQ